MPATTPYPNETPEEFQLRMQQQAMGAPGAAAAPPAGGAAMPWMAPPQRMAPGAGVMLPPGAGGGVSPGAMASTGQLPPDAAYGAMLGTYGDQLALGSMEGQLAEANALRDTALPEMRGAGGRVQTAANPLEFIGAGIKQYKGAKEGKRLKGEIAAKQKDIGGRVATYGDLIRQQLEDENNRR